MKTIIILSDSLNRHYLPMYGNDWVIAPNLKRFAERSVVFDNHWIGSAPCMPARRDILTGRLNFLEREWGGALYGNSSIPSCMIAQRQLLDRPGLPGASRLRERNRLVLTTWQRWVGQGQYASGVRWWRRSEDLPWRLSR